MGIGIQDPAEGKTRSASSLTSEILVNRTEKKSILRHGTYRTGMRVERSITSSEKCVDWIYWELVRYGGQTLKIYREKLIEEREECNFMLRASTIICYIYCFFFKSLFIC